MKRIIILSLLLYYISCKTLCSSLELSSEKDRCLSYEVEDTAKNHCCYLEVNTGISGLTLNVCYGFPKGITEESIKHIIADLVKTVQLDENIITLNTYVCNKASYLKVGFLLLSLFLI